MSWHFSLELEADYWRATLSDGERSVPLRSTGTDGPSLCFDRESGTFRDSPSGTIFARSTVSHGEDVLTWYLEAFPVNPTHRRLEAATLRTISGRRCGESWQRQLPGTYSRRTSHGPQLTRRQTTSNRWVTPSDAFPFPRQTWALTMHGNAIGYVHTPTATANYAAPSMQKWQSCRSFVRAFGLPSPEVHEHLMDWPTGWSALKPLAKDKWHAWLQRHGAS